MKYDETIEEISQLIDYSDRQSTIEEINNTAQSTTMTDKDKLLVIIELCREFVN